MVTPPNKRLDDTTRLEIGRVLVDSPERGAAQALANRHGIHESTVYACRREYLTSIGQTPPTRAARKSKPRVGKSRLMAQLARQHNATLVDVHLSQHDSDNLRGIPVPQAPKSKPIPVPQAPGAHAVNAMQLAHDVTELRRELEAAHDEIALLQKIIMTLAKAL